MKTSTVLIIGGAVVAIALIAMRAKSTGSILGAPKAPSTGASTAGQFFGGALSGFFSSPSSSKPVSSGALSAGSSNGGGASYAPDTATSNYLADTTASSDDSTGVVGFGGWD